MSVFAQVHSVEPWNRPRVAQLRLDESGLSDDERWVREGPCSTVLSKKRQGLRTKTNKWQVSHISNICTEYSVSQHYSV